MKKNIIIFTLISLFFPCLYGMRPSRRRPATPHPYIERPYTPPVRRSFSPVVGENSGRITPVVLADKYPGVLYHEEYPDNYSIEEIDFSSSDMERGFQVLLKKIKKLKKEFIEEYGSLKFGFLAKVTVFVYKLEELINIQNSDGQTMFQFLIQTDPDIILLMIKTLDLEYLIDIDHADIDGNTALFFALYSNQPEVAKWLIDNGANLQCKNKLNEVASDYLRFIKNDKERNMLAIRMGIEN